MRVGRLGVVVLLLVVLQVTVFTHLRLFGVVPDLGLILAVAIAYRHGPEAGALTGFAAGLAYDLFLETPLALSALTYALTAYAVGMLQAGMLREPRGITPVIGGLSGLAGGFVFAGLGILAGVEGIQGNRTVYVVALAATYDAVVAPAVFWLVNRLVDDDRSSASGLSFRA
jgi:rod shape-determining protein MreD